MNIADAKSIPLDELLQRLDFQPAKQQGGRLWYRSPFRDEKTPSFVLSKDCMAWYDHGEGKGGNIIDLAMRLGDCRDVSQALSWLDDKTGHMAMTVPTIRQRLPVTPEPPAYTLIGVQSFTVRNQRNGYTPAALYLKNDRGIDPQAFARYLSEVTYKGRDGKSKRGFGMPTHSGGYEIRRAGDWAKTSVGHKSFTVFQAEVEEPADAAWRTFYGMMDFGTFLTMRTIKSQPVHQFNYLIVHGDAMAQAASEYLAPLAVADMLHYPDNDGNGSGHRAMLTIMESTHGGGDMAHEYAGFKDLNAYWQAHLGITRVTPQIAPASQPASGLRHTPKI